jgi:DCN1-like protein 1/2
MVSFYLHFSWCSEKAALTALKASDWNLEGAFEIFYNQPPARPITDPRYLEELYVRYKGRREYHS